MSRLGRIGLVVALATGCSGSVTGGPDAGPGDGADGGDGGATGSGGLRLVFESRPESIPGEVGGDFDAYLESATLELRDVRAIGDAAPGDSRTTRDKVVLDWSESDTHEVIFREAPAGSYSLLKGEIAYFSLQGTVEIDSSTENFRIEDTPAGGLPFSANMQGLTVSAGEVATLEVRVDLREAIREHDWSMVPTDDDGTRVIVGDSELMEEAYEKLEEAFKIPD